MCRAVLFLDLFPAIRIKFAISNLLQSASSSSTNASNLRPSAAPDALPNAASIAAKIESFFETGATYFLPGLQEEKKKYSWKKMTAAIFEMAGIQ